MMVLANPFSYGGAIKNWRYWRVEKQPINAPACEFDNTIVNLIEPSDSPILLPKSDPKLRQANP